MVDRQGRMSRQGNGRQEGKDGRKRNGRQEGKDGQVGEEEWAGNFRPAPTWYRPGSDRRNRASIDESIIVPTMFDFKVLE